MIAPGPAKPAAADGAGLVVRADRRPAPKGLLALPARGLQRVGAPEGFAISRALFLDTETTGLSGGAGTVAFMVGLGYVDGGDFVSEQYMLRDYGDEPEMLLRLSEVFSRFDTAITFNGKTFDMPLLETRFTMCRLRERWQAFEQLDLLHPSRRVWKLRLKSCRLSELEARVLGVRREGDLPGSEAPERFFQYLRTGDMAPLEDVFRHNLQDVITLGALLSKLAHLFDAPQTAEERLDLFSLGKALEKQDDREAAELFKRSRDLPEGSLRLYHIHRRGGDWEAARGVLEGMVRAGQMGWIPHIELAKIYEHREHNHRRAMFYAKIALAMCDARERPAIERRLQRLARKQLAGGTDN